MKNIVVFCGGVSAEHEVSLRSACNIIAALDKTQFTPILVTISRTGTWYIHSDVTVLEHITECCEPFFYGEIGTMLRVQNETFLISQHGLNLKVDAAFPIIHGPMGEDGTLQGLFEIMDLAYVGSGVLSSAVGMDKDVLKRILESVGLPVVPFLCLSNPADYISYDASSRLLDSKILFIKPAVMGSSVGVSKITSAEEYALAVNHAFKYSTKVLVETFIACRELECAVLGNQAPQASCVGEIKSHHDFYSYEAKYIDPNGAEIIIPANLDPKLAGQVAALSIKAYQAIECKGLARVDFFLSHHGEVFINEINTLPGFTAISMYPKLWEASGINYSDLITTLIDLAFAAQIDKQQICLLPDLFGVSAETV